MDELLLYVAFDIIKTKIYIAFIMSIKTKTDKTTNMSSDKCAACAGKCCRYTLVDLPAPRSRLDFNNYAWYLAHEDIEIYYDDKKWYLAVNNRCRYLDENNRCMIYEKRFEACRDHTDENCEFDSDYVADLIFDDPFQLLEFAEKRFKKKGNKKTKRKITLKK